MPKSHTVPQNQLGVTKTDTGVIKAGTRIPKIGTGIAKTGTEGHQKHMKIPKNMLRTPKSHRAPHKHEEVPNTSTGITKTDTELHKTNMGSQQKHMETSKNMQSSPKSHKAPQNQHGGHQNQHTDCTLHRASTTLLPPRTAQAQHHSTASKNRAQQHTDMMMVHCTSPSSAWGGVDPLHHAHSAQMSLCVTSGKHHHAAPHTAQSPAVYRCDA